MLSFLPCAQNENLLGGTRDDAAVYRLLPELAVVQTVDFITPVVNDPYAFGAVAAANAISDIYAVGARPVLALNLTCFPVKTLSLSYLGQIMKGGCDKAAEAGVVVAGGHSVEDSAPKYGMAVTGVVHPDRVVTKGGAIEGDVLILTKPLGTGIITTAIDRGLAGEELEDKVSRIMVQLNKGAAEAMVAVGVSACTDVSGYGLMGHLHEMMMASGISARVSLKKVPVIAETWELAQAGAVPNGTHNNYRFLRDKVEWGQQLPPEARMVLCDAQTSGGLLMAVPSERAERLQAALLDAGCIEAAIVGEVVSGPKGTMTVTP
ncbi:hypothetical protein SY88_05755 [Clostridiales bacterium PH28_bin88]|nr:hypothetical protein SY88_05755 [Clostridiales bacterium PH28_bin88]